MGAHTNDPGAAAKEFVSNVLSQSGAESAGNVLNIAGGALSGNLTSQDDKNINADTGAIGNAFVPASGALNAIGNATDKYSRDSSASVKDAFLSKNPLTRPLVPAKTDTLGNPVANPDVVGSTIVTKSTTISGTKNSTQKAVSAEIERLNNAGFNATPAKAVKNPNAQSDASILINSGIYKGADPKAQADMLHTVLEGSKLSGISTKLSPADRSTLIQTTLLGGPKTAIWREDNNNDLGYVKAQINNGKADGTFNPMTDGDINHTGSLAQQLAEARVNQQNNVSNDLKQSYADTSKTDFDKITPGSDLFNALVNYDKERIAAGLPSKYQNSKGGYSSLSGSSSLPTSNATIAPEKSSGITAGTAKYVPPKLAVATVGTSKNDNPFIRSITATKGVKL